MSEPSSTPQHTPNRWKYTPRFLNSEHDGFSVRRSESNMRIGIIETEADARLICAAPDLLAASKLAKAYLLEPENYEGTHAVYVLRQLAEAISHAEGRAQ